MKNKITTLWIVALFLGIQGLKAQDLPSTAVNLTVGIEFSDFAVVATNVDATNSEDTDPSIPFPSCSFYSGGDLWYSVEVPSEGIVILETRDVGNTIDDTGMAVYEGSIGDLVELKCDDDSGEGNFSRITITNRPPGEILFIRVFEYGNSDFGEFLIGAYTNNLSIPSNDNFDGALALTVGSVFSDYSVVANNTFATNSELADPTLPFPTCASYNGGDLWYFIEVPDEGIVTLQTGIVAGGIEDTGMSVYEGTAGELSEVECNDDEEIGLFSKISLTNRTPGEILYVRVFEYSNNVFGEFKISAFTGIIPTPLNDNLEGALPLTVGVVFEDFAVEANNTSASNSEEVDPSISDPTCSSYEGGDLWYSLEVPSEGMVTVETKDIENGSGIEDTGMSIYEGTIGALVEVDCSDDDGLFLHSLISLTGRTPGEILYVRVFEYANDEFGQFQISAYGDLVNIGEQSIIEGFSYSPNPVENVLSLNANSPIESIKVFNLLGEKMMAEKASNSDYQLDVSALVNGTYLIEVKTDHQIGTYRFVKI